jgi:hypothetical protein
VPKSGRRRAAPRVSSELAFFVVASHTQSRFELLRKLVSADQAIRPERRTFRVTNLRNPRSRVLIRFPGIGNGQSHVRWERQDIEDLEAAGFLRIRRDLERQHDQWEFDITDAGFEEVKRRVAAEGQPRQLGSLDWGTEVLPVLNAVYSASASAYPGLGLNQKMINDELERHPDDPGTARVLEELVRANYLEMTAETHQSVGPDFCRLTEKGLQITAGWPSGAPEAFLDRLLAEIDRRISEAQTHEERTKWERLRDGVTGVGRDVLTNVLSSVAEGAVRGAT